MGKINWAEVLIEQGEQAVSKKEQELEWNKADLAGKMRHAQAHINNNNFLAAANGLVLAAELCCRVVELEDELEEYYTAKAREN